MADYLHGHVQSKLLALSLSLGLCQQSLIRDPAAASLILERVQSELQKVQDEDLRQVSRELYPAIIKMGLVPAMRSLVSRFSELVEIDLFIDTKFEKLDREGEAALPEKRRLVAYRIAEEALNNVLKHAEATSVQVRLFYQEPEQLVLSLVDDGCGFDSGLSSPGQGLAMMTDYAQALGGRTVITASPGEGTSVRLVLSLDGAESSAVPSLCWNQIEVTSR
jgi:signal transduction histidine kinase